MVKVTMHGILGEELGFKDWNLNVSSLGEAINAIDSQTKKLRKILYNKDQEGVRYKVIINGKAYKSKEKLDPNNLETIKNSELAIKRKNLKTIDIVPVLEGAGDSVLGIFTAILGAALAVIGIVTGQAYLVLAGLSLLAGGITSLLMKPPKFEDFREIDGATGRTSYLFNGPQNTTQEGGPVPLLYGRLIVGSQVISAAYKVSHIQGEAVADDLSHLSNELFQDSRKPTQYISY